MRYLERIAKEALRKAKLQRIRVDEFGCDPAIGVIVAGVIFDENRPFHLTSWRKLLKRIGFWEKTVRQCEDILRDERWITASKDGGRWLTLGSIGWKLFGFVKEQLPSKIKANILQAYDKFEGEARNNAVGGGKIPFDSLRKQTQEKGTDLLLYVSKGDYERSLWGARKLTSLRRRLYGYVLAGCPPKRYQPEGALEKLERISREISRLGIKNIPDEWWGKDYTCILDSIDEPRAHLDILVPGFPRQAVFALDMALREFRPYTYSMYYVKAPHYPSTKAETLKPIEWTTRDQLIKESGSRSVAVFGEITDHRLKSDFLQDILSRDILVHLFLPDSRGSGYQLTEETDIDRKVCIESKKSWSESKATIREQYIDYACPEIIYHKLLYTQPEIIYAGGSRSVMVSISRYCSECPRLGIPPPRVVFTHVEAEVYAKGVIPKMFSLGKPSYSELNVGRKVA